MNINTTNKKKLELKKTAIANLTLNEAQMRMVVGGDGDANFNLSRIPTKINNTDDGNGCTAKEPQKNNTN